MVSFQKLIFINLMTSAKVFGSLIKKAETSSAIKKFASKSSFTKLVRKPGPRLVSTLHLLLFLGSSIQSLTAKLEGGMFTLSCTSTVYVQ